MSAQDGHRERQHLVPRRVVVRSLLRSAALSVSLILAYYLLPLQPGTGAALTWLVGGLTLVVVVIASQVRAILTAKYPWLRTITVLAVGTPLLIVAFAATYFLMASSDPASFSQPLDRTAALYFTVTVLATVGFGDITPVTTIARVAATVQMVLDIAFIGLAAKVLFGAADRGVRNRAAGERTDDDEAAVRAEWIPSRGEVVMDDVVPATMLRHARLRIRHRPPPTRMVRRRHLDRVMPSPITGGVKLPSDLSGGERVPNVERRTNHRAGYASGAPASAVSRALIPASTDGFRLRAVGPDDHPLERGRWSQQLTRLLAHEIQRAMVAGVVTGAEADQLLARLVLVIDQAVESFP